MFLGVKMLMPRFILVLREVEDWSMKRWGKIREVQGDDQDQQFFIHIVYL